MVFSVVTYGYESWTIKKFEHQRTDAFELWCWRRLLRVRWTAKRSNCCRKRDPLPELESGLLSNAQKLIDWGDPCADKAIYFFGKGCLGGEQRENPSVLWLAVSGFMVMGWVSGLSLASHLAWPISGDSESFLLVHTSLSQDGFKCEGFRKVGKTPRSSSWPLLNSPT